MDGPENNSAVEGGKSGQAKSASPRLRPSGGYRELRTFQAATIIYDGTAAFCERFVDRRSRTVVQMVQAARSGRQNIAEGSRAAAISSQTELRLVSVARASLDELLLDYEDYLRQRSLEQWPKDHPEARKIRAVGAATRDLSNPSDPTDSTDPSDHRYDSWLKNTDPAIVANALICLIHQANYLLDRQITALERAFVHEGGYSEQLAAARITERQQPDRPDRSDPPNKQPQPPACPLCGKPLALRTARNGPRAGSQFWGCAQYPHCKGTRPFVER